MSTFALEIVTPTKTVDQGEVTYIRCPGADGLFGVMAGHTPGLFALSAGEIKVAKEGKSQYFATSGGFAEVTGEKVQLLLETIEASTENDLERSREALERATSRLSSGEGDPDRTRRAIARAKNRLKVSQR